MFEFFELLLKYLSTEDVYKEDKNKFKNTYIEEYKDTHVILIDKKLIEKLKEYYDKEVKFRYKDTHLKEVQKIDREILGLTKKLLNDGSVKSSDTVILNRFLYKIDSYSKIKKDRRISIYDIEKATVGIY